MTLYIHNTFLADLRDYGDSSLAQRVLAKVLEPSGSFRLDRDDHRYKGIEDAWIRYVSAGRTAFRVIYLRKGEHIHLYRAGPHTVEDNLSGPKINAEAAVLSTGDPTHLSARGMIGVADSATTTEENSVPNSFLQNGRKRLLSSFLLGRRLIPHKEVVLVSPYLSLDLLQRSSRFGATIDNLIEDGTKVSLITRWPAASDLASYREFEVRGIDMLFHKTVHAKLYVFKVRNGDSPYDQDHTDAALIGSANLTGRGFGFDERDFNEELCFELPTDSHGGAMEFVYHLLNQSIDLTRVRHELSKR